MSDIDPVTGESFDKQTGEVVAYEARAQAVDLRRNEYDLPSTYRATRPAIAVEPIQFSPTIGKLAGALAKAQAAVRGATKDANNPFFRSKYADLASAWDACREAVTSNALAVIQTPYTEGERVGVVTMLVHESGEWIQGRVIVLPTKELKNGATVTNFTAQGVGSVITYLRRYALMAMVGVAPEDDDGNQGTKGASQPGQQRDAHQAAPAGGPAAKPATPEQEQAKAHYYRIQGLIKEASSAEALTTLAANETEALTLIKKLSPTGYKNLSDGFDARRAQLASPPAKPNNGAFDADADEVPL